MQAGHGASRGRAADGYRAPEGCLSSSDLIYRRERTSNRKPVCKRLRRRADAFPGISLGDDRPAGTVCCRRCKADGGPIARSAVRAAVTIGVTLKRALGNNTGLTKRPHRRQPRRLIRPTKRFCTSPQAR